MFRRHRHPCAVAATAHARGLALVFGRGRAASLQLRVGPKHQPEALWRDSLVWVQEDFRAVVERLKTGSTPPKNLPTPGRSFASVKGCCRCNPRFIRTVHQLINTPLLRASQASCFAATNCAQLCNSKIILFVDKRLRLISPLANSPECEAAIPRRANHCQRAGALLPPGCQQSGLYYCQLINNCQALIDKSCLAVVAKRELKQPASGQWARCRRSHRWDGPARESAAWAC
ncbi:hypothetical protein ETAA8_07920 [Anatilimnocola aggregata]|uniref:Uncharacterized protein n=1 Tax=Anatilimnocola aggregata TaxID=2528021 RepID=A0A517Y6G5_9BACT|nr:hypothetical protein ETAA8_07920 [Anatilimnocola aggregata]